MQLVLHTGVHFTEEERLIKTLLRNAGDLAKRGVSVPGPGRYRALLRGTLNALSKAAAAPNAREFLLDAIIEDTRTDRLILSDSNMFRTASTAFQDGRLYPSAPTRMARMAQLFAQDQIEIFMAIRNPATFLPLVFSHSKDHSVDSFMGGTSPYDVRWSDLLTSIREAVPQAVITVWCSEDMPLIWAQIIREMGGLEHGEKIVGGFDLLSTIMSQEGMKRFRGYLKEHPVMTEVQKRRAIVAFLDKFAIEDEIEEELDMPGWTDALVAEMSEVYDEDLLAIQRIPGVQIISP